MQHEKSFYHRCEFYMLIALELLMAFTSLGYIHVPPISIALAYIPILLTGALCGVQESMMMGMVFGLTSLCKASVTYALPADAAFSPFGSGKSLESLLLSVGTRTLYADAGRNAGCHGIFCRPRFVHAGAADVSARMRPHARAGS